MSKKIVVATDGSDTSWRAVEKAAELSDRLNHDLCIVHVNLHGRPSEELMRLAEAEHLVPEPSVAAPADGTTPRLLVDEFARTIQDRSRQSKAIVAMGHYVVDGAVATAESRGARNVTARICTGDYADEILEVARDEEADMIVLGRRGLGRIRETLFGSVSQKVLHHAPCTVVVVQ